MDLADDYERLRAILDEVEPLYDIAKDEVLNNLSAQRVEMFNADNQEIFEVTPIGKLTIAEKEAIFRAEHPKLVDKVTRAKKAMKRIRESFDNYRAISISFQSGRKHEAATSGLTP